MLALPTHPGFSCLVFFLVRTRELISCSTVSSVFFPGTQPSQALGAVPVLFRVLGEGAGHPAGGRGTGQPRASVLLLTKGMMLENR